jgi:hypothetical protein
VLLNNLDGLTLENPKRDCTWAYERLVIDRNDPMQCKESWHKQCEMTPKRHRVDEVLRPHLEAKYQVAKDLWNEKLLKAWRTELTLNCPGCRICLTNWKNFRHLQKCLAIRGYWSHFDQDERFIVGIGEVDKSLRVQQITLPPD